MTDAPLSGLKVLDFSLNLPGPYATMVLASLGCEVVKIEPPRGDPARHIGALFPLLNRGKKSVLLDLRDPKSNAHLKALVQRSDILVEGFRPGVMARLGCGPEQAMAWNPRLIYCSISAFGQEGPRRSEPGHDLNLQALTGLCHLERDRTGAPRASVLPVADLSAAMAAVVSINAALLQRERTGEGRVLDVAMADALAHWTTTWAAGVDLLAPLRSTATGKLVSKTPWFKEIDRQRLYALPHYGLYGCRDGRWLAIGVVDEHRFWTALCTELGMHRTAKLPVPARAVLGRLIRKRIALHLRTRSRAHWLERFAGAGVPVTAVTQPKDVLDDPQLAGRELRNRAPLPGAESLRGPVPALGADTEAVLRSLPG